MRPAAHRVVVLGAGAWGTAFAALLAGSAEVTLWGRDAGQVEAMERARTNARYLPGIMLPAGLRVTSDFRQAIRGADLLVLAVPSAALETLLGEIDAFGLDAPAVSLAKGFVGSPSVQVRLAHEIVRRRPGLPFAVLSGPSFAEEIARGLPAAATLAATTLPQAAWFVEQLRRDTLRLYATDDVVGVEVGGAVKNVLAIAAGISDGLALGHNARAALITRGLAELARLAVALGGRRETAMGLSGLGDLVLTCTGALSRNRRVGVELASGARLSSILGHLGHVAEGVRTAQLLPEIARANAVDMPIAAAVAEVVAGRLRPDAAVRELLRREPRPEAH